MEGMENIKYRLLVGFLVIISIGSGKGKYFRLRILTVMLKAYDTLFIVIILFYAAQLCAPPLAFLPLLNSCIPCPKPLTYNPDVRNCTLPCLISFISDSKINSMRITTIVIAWFNVVFISSVLIIYSLRAPRRWITFSNNLMLTMLAVALPVSDL